MLYTLYNTSVRIPKKLECLGLTPIEQTLSPSIEIEFSGDNYKNKGYLNNQFFLNPEYGFYYRKGIGFFEFLNGRVIKVHLEGDADISFFQTLLNFPFACIFAQSGLLPIHASAVRYKNKTILFPGMTQKGKSSLAAVLINSGGKLITEDIALFRTYDDEAKIIPSYPLIKLSEEVNKEIIFTTEQPLKLMKSDLKRDLFTIDQKDFFTTESKIDIVIYPEWSEVEELRPISSKKSVLRMISSNFFTTEIPSLETDSIKNNLSIIKDARCFEFYRKKEIKNIKNFKKEIERLLV